MYRFVIAGEIVPEALADLRLDDFGDRLAPQAQETKPLHDDRHRARTIFSRRVYFVVFQWTQPSKLALSSRKLPSIAQAVNASYLRGWLMTEQVESPTPKPAANADGSLKRSL